MQHYNLSEGKYNRFFNILPNQKNNLGVSKFDFRHNETILIPTFFTLLTATSK